MSGAFSIHVQRNGRTHYDLTICQHDEVKSDGWQYVYDRELVYAEQLIHGKNPIALFGLEARIGDWIVIRGHGALPQVCPESEFRCVYSLGGYYDGKPLYIRTERLRALRWMGEGVIRLYDGTTPTGVYQTVRRGDWIVAGDAGRYTRLPREAGDLYLRPGRTD